MPRLYVGKRIEREFMSGKVKLKLFVEKLTQIVFKFGINSVNLFSVELYASSKLCSKRN